MRIEAVLMATLLWACTLPAQALQVFACEPEWAALTRVLLPQARIDSATRHTQDPHHIEARPSLIALMRQADLAVCTGAELESGWLPMLLDKASNPRVQAGRPGLFLAAEHVNTIDRQPQASGPFAGDVHHEGNPHLHADPERLLQVAHALATRLAELAPTERAGVQARLQAFEQQHRQKIAQWTQQAQGLRGRSVVAQHSTFGYLWAWLGMQVLADLEPQPGLPPTPAHLQRLTHSVRQNPPLAMVVATHQDPRPARWLAQQMPRPSPVLVLPATVTDDRPDALWRWYEQLLTALLAAAR